MAQLGIGIIVSASFGESITLDEIVIIQSYELINSSNIISGSSGEPSCFDQPIIFQASPIASGDIGSSKEIKFTPPELIVQGGQAIKEGV